MIVMKFGGTSLSSHSELLKAASIIKSKTEQAVIVVSALAGVTNDITAIMGLISDKRTQEAFKLMNQIFDRHLNLVEKLELDSNLFSFIDSKKEEFKDLIEAVNILGEITPKAKDMILSMGEVLSSNIVYQTLLKSEVDVAFVDPREIMETDSNFCEANVRIEESRNKANTIFFDQFVNKKFVVTGGFIAADVKGNTTTLGRGGSDYTAALIASFLDAERLEIWTDVNGIMSSDPKIINDPKLISTLSYSEAAELAFFGAKVLHPKTILPAVEKFIPVYVLNTFNPGGGGTKIYEIKTNNRFIKAIAFKKGITIINIHSDRMLGVYGFLNTVFRVFDKHKTPVDLVATSEVSISCTTEKAMNLECIVDELREFSTVTVHKNKAILSVVGEGITDTAGIGARFFNTLKGINIQMVSVGASEVNLSVVVAEEDLEQSVKLLHQEFFSDIMDNDVFTSV